MEVTGTFKYTKTSLSARDTILTRPADALYFNHPEHQAFVRLDKALYGRIQSGEVRL